MTREEARRRAVEAAALWLAYEMSWSDIEARYFVEGVLRESDRAMADAGWRMVRVVEPEIERDFPGPLSARDVLALQVGRQIGHNACRAAMLADPDA